MSNHLHNTCCLIAEITHHIRPHLSELRPKDQPAESTDMDRIASILKKTGYQGYVVLEHEANEDPWEFVPRHMKTMRAALLG